MLPINLLQSQLAHNKKRINELQHKILIAKANRGYVLRTLKKQEDLSLEEELSCKDSVISWNLQIKKTRKQLKQLAILQKAIKTSISLQAMEEACLDAEYNNIGV